MVYGQQRSYEHCNYNAQGFLECKRNDDNVSNTAEKNHSLMDKKIVIEPFVESTPRGKDVDNNIVRLAFTERPTSRTIWDKTSANIICVPLCSRFNQEWTQGFRSVGGSVCYCQDIPTPSTSAKEKTSTQSVNTKRSSEITDIEPRVYSNAEMMQMNYL
jgi:hypothetical protein